MYTITKKFEFEACHKLKLPYKSACVNLHGHSYKVEITVKSCELNENGMVIDFSDLNAIKDWVMENWDHTTLIPINDVTDEAISFCGKVFQFQYPNVTAEYMCKYLHEKVCSSFGFLGSIVEVKIYETSNNFATYTEE